MFLQGFVKIENHLHEKWRVRTWFNSKHWRNYLDPLKSSKNLIPSCRFSIHVIEWPSKILSQLKLTHWEKGEKTKNTHPCLQVPEHRPVCPSTHPCRMAMSPRLVVQQWQHCACARPCTSVHPCTPPYTPTCPVKAQLQLLEAFWNTWKFQKFMKYYGDDSHMSNNIFTKFWVKSILKNKNMT